MKDVFDQVVEVGEDGVKYTVDPSKWKAAAITAASLCTFAALMLATVVKFLSARDFVGLWVFLQREEVISGLTQFASLAFLGWRVWRATRKKDKEVAIAKSSPIAVLTTEVATPAPVADPIEPMPYL